MFLLTRIYSDKHGDSHFEDVTVPLKDAGPVGSLSEMISATGVIFREVDPSYDYDFHNPPQRQYIFLLDGEIEIETSLGEKRNFKAGNVLLVEDITGKGHKTRNLFQEKCRSVFIPLEQ